MFTGNDLAVIIPTRDRPSKLMELLESFCRQSIICQRIIIVDSGENIENVLQAYINVLHLEYYRTDNPGQISQRNLGISKLTNSTEFVCLFDDDIVLHDGALEAMVSFWNNNCPHNTAGVSFNIVNGPIESHNFITGLIGQTGPQAGKVLRSGRNTSIAHIRQSIKTEWLCGGATVWRQEVLLQYPHMLSDSKWAIYEDLIYSFPIGKIFPMFVCADARVDHNHVYREYGFRHHSYLGYSETLWRFAFVKSNSDLSVSYFFWNQSAAILGRFFLCIFKFQIYQLYFIKGMLMACVIAVKLNLSTDFSISSIAKYISK
jgi:glycosyltransferase involved in cell wall biosynthesis